MAWPLNLQIVSPDNFKSGWTTTTIRQSHDRADTSSHPGDVEFSGVLCSPTPAMGGRLPDHDHPVRRATLLLRGFGRELLQPLHSRGGRRVDGDRERSRLGCGCDD